MAKAAAPLIQLETGASAPVIRYDIPEPTSYEGKNFVELLFEDDIYSAAAFEMPSQGTGEALQNLPLETIRSEVETLLRTGVSDRSELPNLVPSTVAVGGAGTPVTGGATLEPTVPEPAPPTVPTPPAPPSVDPDLVDGFAGQIRQGFHLVKSVNVFGEPTVSAVPVPTVPEPHLYLVETLRLTSFLGDYGAGRIVKTFTLLPGEVTKISVKTFRQTESTSKSASSVLDSLTRESATDLETSLMSEQSDQRSFQKSKEYYADAEASAGWGWGSAKVKAGVKGSSNAAREESVKNVSNATQKHSSRASAKRDVEINTSYEVTEKTGEERSTERQIENINLSRTLNFVFRQMNQEFVTLLHLTDVRVGFFNGDRRSRREVPISDIDSLLADVVKAKHREPVRDMILEQLTAVRDAKGKAVNVVKTVSLSNDDVYRHFDPDLRSVHVDDQKRRYEVPGVLLKADHHVMRTEGVMVEALLGTGPALDSYAAELQALEVDRRKAVVAKSRALAAQLELVNSLIADGDAERAAIAEKVAWRCENEEGSERPAEPEQA